MKLPFGPIRFRRVRLTTGTSITFDARVRDEGEAAEALRRIADAVTQDAKKAPRSIFVHVEIDRREGHAT